MRRTISPFTLRSEKYSLSSVELPWWRVSKALVNSRATQMGCSGASSLRMSRVEGRR